MADYKEYGLIPSARTRQRRLARAGFTMMEVVATLVLLGVTMTLGGSSLRNALTSFRLDSAAGQITGDLRLARMMAMRNNTPITVTFDTGSSYHIESRGGRSLPKGIMFTVAPFNMQFQPDGRRAGAGINSRRLALGDREEVITILTSGSITQER